MTKKYNGMKNVTGKFIFDEIKKRGFSQEEICKKLELLGILINRQQLNLISKNCLLLKDFELIGICKILDIDMNILKNLIDE